MEQSTKVSTASRHNVGVIELAGDVTSQAEQGITEGVQKLEREGLKKFLLKFNEATYINSSGLAIVITLVSEGKKKKQTFAASGLSKHFQKVFDVIGLTDYLDIYATEEEAIRKL
jgi:anti-sigma B factor antagonist